MCFVFMLDQVSDTLKKFAVKVTTSSVKERKDVLGELKHCISGKGEMTTPVLVVALWCYFSV